MSCPLSEREKKKANHGVIPGSIHRQHSSMRFSRRSFNCASSTCVIWPFLARALCAGTSLRRSPTNTDATMSCSTRAPRSMYNLPFGTAGDRWLGSNGPLACRCRVMMATNTILKDTTRRTWDQSILRVRAERSSRPSWKVLSNSAWGSVRFPEVVSCVMRW